ncbi:MAG: hypothetical protein EP346_13390 [Bacteroidetes bacterium]|nr:MAG: hypothetical protein EP346_13390 [Bacteroidota bacterium]
MSNTLEVDKKSTSEYRKWSLRIFIYQVIIQISLYYLVANFSAFSEEAIVEFSEKVFLINILANLLLVAGIVTSILALYKKETMNYQLMIGMIGNGIFLLIALLTLSYRI